MSEYWKSTPSYWCKFCSQYVRDTGIERKNHETSARHQNSIQRSIRDLSKTKDREERDKQRAKSEVARLNGLVDSGPKPHGTKSASGPKILGVQDLGGGKGSPASNATTAQQRRAHAEQLAAMGVKLPAEMEREVTGVGGWQTVSERVIVDNTPIERSLADFVKNEGEHSKEDVEIDLPLVRGVHKRKAEDEEEDAEQRSKRKAWGSRLKTYPGTTDAGDEGDLDALLSGVAKKKDSEAEAKKEDEDEVKEEEAEQQSLSAIPNIGEPAVGVKTEDGEMQAPIMFKKRKAKR